MSCPVKLQALPAAVFGEVLTPENVRGRAPTNSLSPLSFPKSRLSLWDGGATGAALRLQLCSHRRPRILLLEKALRLAQRHVRHSNKPLLHCFFLGSVCVDSDEMGVTISLDRFDPGRDQVGSRVPSALLPGDVLVPCVFSARAEASPGVQSEAELHHSFKALQQYLSSRQTLDLSQLLKVKGQVVCSQQGDASWFSLSWSAVSPSVALDVEPLRLVPIIPTALFRSLSSADRSLRHSAACHRGFLTMDQTRKLLLMLESDPKASTLPLVGVWLSGLTHIQNPRVISWCLRFLFSAALQDRVLSESGCFLLVLFGDTHRAPQFFQCRGPGPGPGPQLDCELLTGSHCVTLYQVAPVDGQTLQCELSAANQRPVFRAAQSSENSAPLPAAALSHISEQDSGVEDEDLSPRPSPSPHAAAQQSRRLQPSVPELSVLIDGSFTWQDRGSAHRPPPPPLDRKSAHPTGYAPSSSPSLRAPPHHLHSTPASHMQPRCTCCSLHTCNSTPILPPGTPPPLSTSRAAPSSHHPSPPSSHTPPPPPLRNTTTTPPPSSTRGPPPSRHPSSPSSPSTPAAPPGPCLPPPPCQDQVGGVSPADTYQLLLHQDQQLRLLQAQVQMLLEAQAKLQVQSQTRTSSVAVGTGASLLWAEPVQPAPPHTTSSSSSSSRQSHDLSVSQPVGGTDISHQEAPCCSPSGPQCDPQQTSGGGDLSACNDQQQSFYNNLMTQLTNRLQESDNRQEEEEEAEEERSSGRSQSTVDLSSRGQQSPESVEHKGNEEEREEPGRRRSLSAAPSSSRRRQQSPDRVMDATLRQLQQLGVDLGEGELMESDERRAAKNISTLAGISPAAVVSRLSASGSSMSLVSAGGSVDLSLEANAIALRYLSDAQLSRWSLGEQVSRPGLAAAAVIADSAPSSSSDSILSPSNMSLGTRHYMRKYGLIEEDEEEDEEEPVKVPKVATRRPLGDAPKAKLLAPNQLVPDARQQRKQPMTRISSNKENVSSRPPSLLRASGRQVEASVGNILDLSRLRQLPKLF